MVLNAKVDVWRDIWQADRYRQSIFMIEKNKITYLLGRGL